MEIFYLRIILMLIGFILVLFFNVAGTLAYHGIKIYFLVRKHGNGKKNKKPPKN
ncbi:hypothetical protein [Heyndrickxia sporothermodurans]|uniref:hypothetical protein n=1 Tax=Heyndrickxia sporothermodurans TaxID=46224 RepID=UPI0035D9EF3C